MSASPAASGEGTVPVASGTSAYDHPRLVALIDRACGLAAQRLPVVGLAHPCDAHAIEAAARIRSLGLARPVLVGARETILAAAEAAQVDVTAFEIVDSEAGAIASATRTATLASQGAVDVLMKGSLHTDELMAAVVKRSAGLRTERRVSHAFLFDLPRHAKLLAVADCVVNIAPHLHAKRDILGNAVQLLQRIGIAAPKVAIVAAVETVNEAIPATLDARELVALARDGAWPGAIVEGPFGFDNAISAEAARIKHIVSQVSGEADLLVVPDLNAGNILYKSFIYLAGGECAGLVLGARVPIVLTSRADSLLARVASVALAVLAVRGSEAVAAV